MPCTVDFKRFFYSIESFFCHLQFCCQIIIIFGVILSTLLTFTSYSLVPNAPLVTRIYHSIHAPHRDAFRRTINMMHYVNIRILLELFKIENHYTKIFLFFYAIFSFLPKSSSIDDGNTWFFGVPMCASCVLDSLLIITEQ